MSDPSAVPAERALSTALATVATAAVAAAAAAYLLPLDLNYRVSGVFDQTVRELVRTSTGFVLGALLGAGTVWLLSARRAPSDFRPGLVALGAAAGGLFGVVASSLLTAVAVVPLANRAGVPGSPGFTRVLSIGRWLLLLPPLLLAFAFAFRAARWSKPKAPHALERAVRALLPPLALAGGLAFFLRGPGFPADAPPAERESWARQVFPAHYPAAADLARRSPAVLADVGEVSAVAPAKGTENRVFHGPSESTATFTLDVVGSRETGQLRAVLTIAGTPPGAAPVFGALAWTASGRTIALDPQGRSPEGSR